MDFFFRFLCSIWGVCPTQRSMFHEGEATHANLCLVDCFRAEIHQSRDAGPPERPQRDARRPVALRKPPSVPQKNSRPSQTQFFIPLCLPNHTSTNQGTTSLRSSIAVPPSLLPVWGFGAAPAHRRYLKSDSLLAGASKTNLQRSAALRGGRALSLASLVANACFVASWVFRI